MLLVASALVLSAATAAAFWPAAQTLYTAPEPYNNPPTDSSELPMCVVPDAADTACVFKSLMGEEENKGFSKFDTPEEVEKALREGQQWLIQAQQADGGWSAAMYAFRAGPKTGDVKRGRRSITAQHQTDDVKLHDVYDTDNNDNPQQPGAFPSDPATTAMACMALMRCGQNTQTGQYAANLKKGLEYLLQTTEANEETAFTNTTIRNTQPQHKLGQNIDVVLTAQCLSNALNQLPKKDPLRKRIQQNLSACVQKIEKSQTQNGSFQGSGWAGVLQSSFANNALESAQQQGVKVDKDVLQRSRDFQQSNYDAETGRVNTDLGAGVVLYSVSSSSRASAQEARKAKDAMQKAQAQGLLKKDDAINAENLSKAGLSKDEALRYATAYQVNYAAKATAQREDVLSGFGNNGGEEFLSYLQTGEGLIIAKDEGWKEWYSNISGKLVKVQNADGSWNGHHCITSPAFCTATCLLVLSVQNDMAYLQR